jgi:hypothetical protein
LARGFDPTYFSIGIVHPEVIKLNTFHRMCDAETFGDTDSKSCCDKGHLGYDIFSLFFHWEQFVEYFGAIALRVSFGGSIDILFLWFLTYLQQRLICCGRQKCYRWNYCHWRGNNNLFT